MLYFKYKMHKIRFIMGLCVPRTPLQGGGGLQRSPDPLAYGFKWPDCKGEGT